MHKNLEIIMNSSCCDLIGTDQGVNIGAIKGPKCLNRNILK